MVFDANGDPVTGVAFGAATDKVSFDNSAGAGSATLPLPAITALSTVSQAGAITNSATEIGSPGALDWPIRITEADPTGSSNATYGADWFEVTNTGTVAIPLSGWRMDDSSPTFASGVPMIDVDSLAPGASAVFVEGNAAKEAAFRSAWYGGDTSLPVGSYTGSGVGLSSGGDEVNLYDSTGHHVTGVKFGAATTSLSFDNHAAAGAANGTVPTIAAVSARGAFGAYVAAGDTGSPGTIAPDATGPAITLGAHADSYVVGDRIQITCAAADEQRGAGLDPANTDCADLDAPASTYGLGQHTITWTATDYAGNARTASVTFTVTTAPDPTPTPTPTPDPTPTPEPPAPVPPAPNPPAPKPAAPAKPVLTRPASAKTGSLQRGVSTKLTHLKPSSKLTLTVRYAGKTLVTIKATAGASGTATVKVKLSKARLARLKGKTLTLRYSITGADGKTTVVTATLKVTG